MPESFQWDPPPLLPEDERILDAYTLVGRPLDQLAYTAEFEEICRAAIDGPIDDSRRHHVFKRLMTLRKMGRLPRTSSLNRPRP